MAERTTIARPYAQAVFELAREQDALGRWSEMLVLASAVAEEPEMMKVIDSPRLDKDQIADLFIDICGDGLDESGRNLVKVMADNRRLPLLPEVAMLYEHERRSAEGTLEADVVSAYPLDETQQTGIARALNQRLGKKVTLNCQTDDSLLGGIVIRAGDLVIDGSVAAQLDKLAVSLKN